MHSPTPIQRFFAPTGLRLLAGALLLALGLALSLRANDEHGPRVLEVKGFKYADFYPAPHQGQMKTLLEGASAQPGRNKLTTVFDARLQLFQQTGEGELVVETPQCVLDSSNHLVRSSSTLHGRSADGRFSIEGEGFLCLQTNSSLLISNRVHSRLLPETSAPKATTATASRPEHNPLNIDSDRFVYATNSGLATYTGHVLVTSTNLNLTAGVLVIHLPMREHQIRTITVQDDVVVDYEGMHATGTQAVYTVTTGLIDVTGQPAWRIGQNEGRGEHLILDRTNHFCQTLGNGYLKLPIHGSGSASFLPEKATGTAAPEHLTNRFLEVRSDFYELHTNRAIFQDRVRVVELAGAQTLGTMSCQRMDLAFSGTNELRQAVAKGNVLIEQNDRQLGGQLANYTGSNSLMTLTGKPWWRAGQREGKGDRILVNMTASEMAVHDNASMRLPASELSQAALTAGGAEAPKPVAKAAQATYADIFAQEYVLRTNDVIFRGGVYITHPQMNWSCETLMAELPHTGGRIENLQAEGGVTFELTSEKGKIHGAGDRAVYSYQAPPTQTNDLLRLTGAPASLLTTNNMRIQNELLILDLDNHKLMAPGDYAMHGSLSGMDTNKFHLPGNSVIK
jgi:lipopolysaccharide export system protein LptA